MDYRHLSEIYQKIEKETKRLQMTDELIGLFRNTSSSELEKVIRLTKGEVRPGYEGIEIGVAERSVVKALYLVTMIPQDGIEERRRLLGDIGDTAEELIKIKKQTHLFREPLTVERVFKNLERMASSEGKDSQELKLKILAELLHDSTPLEAKYITRTVCQKMRLGVADMIIIDALTYSFTEGFKELARIVDLYSKEIQNDLDTDDILSQRTAPIYGLEEYLSKLSEENKKKPVIQQIINELDDLRTRISENREKLVKAYNIHPDLGFLGKGLCDMGFSFTDGISISNNVPLRVMLGERLPSIKDILEKMEGRCSLEYKYDGLRVQAHITMKEEEVTVKLFSRQLENISEQFPDIIDNIKRMFKGKNAIVEGEGIPIDQNTGELLPFQLISKRRGRKYDLKEKVEEVPVNLVLFDCLFLDDASLLDSPILVRRSTIKKVFPEVTEEIDPLKGISISKMEIISDERAGERFFQKALSEGCEGVMAKSISDRSIYQAGSRGWLWIKYKRDYRSELSDTLDLVIVGAFHGAGRRKGKYGAFLMAVYDQTSSMYETICKLGSGFNDEDLIQMQEKIKDHIIYSQNSPKWINSNVVPDIWIEPSIVLEVLGSEITFSPIHSCAFDKLRKGSGLALRFPRFTGRIRNDKGPHDVTTSEEVLEMYGKQVKTIHSG